MINEDFPRRYGGHTKDADKAQKMLVSGRIGASGVRTFHMHVSSVKVADGTAAVDYLARLGDFKSRDEDLEHLIGDPERVKAGAALVETAAIRRRGPQRERVLVKMTFELPASLDRHGRSMVAEIMVKSFEQRGHVAVAAVHARGKVQPHVHLAVTSRPVDLDAGTVDRSVSLVRDRIALKAQRAETARIINHVAGVDLFHPGRLADTGIDRPAKKRIPARAWYAGQRQIDQAKVSLARLGHVATRRWRAEEKVRRKTAATDRREQKLKRLGAVEAAVFRRVEAAASAAAVTEDIRVAAAEAEAERLEQLVEVERRRAEAAEDTAVIANAMAQRARDSEQLAAAVWNKRRIIPGRQQQPAEVMSDKQKSYVRDVYKRLHLGPADLSTCESQSDAWAIVRAYDKAKKAGGKQQPLSGGYRRYGHP